MQYKKFWILVFCLGLIFPLMSHAQSRDVDKRDLRGISPQHYKYIFSVAGGAAVGAGLGYILPGEKTPLKLMMIGGGGASTWFLYTHRATLGPFHDWAMIGSNTALESGRGEAHLDRLTIILYPGVGRYFYVVLLNCSLNPSTDFARLPKGGELLVPYYLVWSNVGVQDRLYTT
jgi:hypothetical protein